MDLSDQGGYSDQNGNIEMKDEESHAQNKRNFKEFQSTHESKLVPKNVYSDCLQTSKLIECKDEDDNGPSQAIIDKNDGVQLMQLKLPSSVRMVTKRYDEDNYEIENEIKFKNDNGIHQTNMCPVDNIVRWRYGPSDGRKQGNNNSLSHLESKDGTKGSNGFDLNDIDPKSIPTAPIESNAKLVQWEDGTYSMCIGDEMFDIRQEEINNSGIFLKHESEFAILKSQINQKFFVKPTVRSTRHVQMYSKKLQDKEAKMALK